MSGRDGRLPGELLRRAAEAILSQRIVDDVVIPVLADLQHEAARAQEASRPSRGIVLARGYVAFWSALGLLLFTWPARSLREDWLAAGAPGPGILRAFAPRAGLLGLILTVVMMPQWPTHWARQAGDPLMALAALPSVLVTTVPVAFLIGLVLSIRGIGARAGGMAPTQYLGAVVGLSAAVALFSFALCGWVTPEANQVYRERFYGWRSVDRLRTTAGGVVRFPADRRPLPKGSRELTLGELHTSIRDARLRGERSGELEAEWHKKWSIPAMCLVLGPLAVGLVSTLRRWSVALPVVYSVAALFVWWTLLRLGEQAARAGRLDPLVAMWIGNVLFAVFAVSLLKSRHPPGALSGAA